LILNASYQRATAFSRAPWRTAGTLRMSLHLSSNSAVSSRAAGRTVCRGLAWALALRILCSLSLRAKARLSSCHRRVRRANSDASSTASAFSGLHMPVLSARRGTFYFRVRGGRCRAGAIWTARLYRRVSRGATVFSRQQNATQNAVSHACLLGTMYSERYAALCANINLCAVRRTCSYGNVTSYKTEKYAARILSRHRALGAAVAYSYRWHTDAWAPQLYSQSLAAKASLRSRLSRWLFGALNKLFKPRRLWNFSQRVRGVYFCWRDARIDYNASLSADKGGFQAGPHPSPSSLPYAHGPAPRQRALRASLSRGAVGALTNNARRATHISRNIVTGRRGGARDLGVLLSSLGKDLASSRAYQYSNGRTTRTYVLHIAIGRRRALARHLTFRARLTLYCRFYHRAKYLLPTPRGPSGSQNNTAV